MSFCNAVCFILNWACVFVVLVSLDSDVSLFSPISSPRVSEDPVISGKTNNHNCMVCCILDASVENSLLIKLKSIIHVDSPCDWALSQSLLHSLSSRHINVFRNFVWTSGLTALLLETSVRILVLSYKSIFSGIIKPEVFKPTITTLTSGSLTVNKLLFWQVQSSTALDQKVRFDDTICTEGPTASTLALLFHMGCCTFDNPVDIHWACREGSNWSGACIVVRWIHRRFGSIGWFGWLNRAHRLDRSWWLNNGIVWLAWTAKYAAPPAGWAGTGTGAWTAAPW